MKLRYGMIIRAISQSYLSLVLSTTLNTFKISWRGPSMSITSNMISLIAVVCMLYIPITAYNILQRTSQLNNPEFQKRYKTFIIDLRIDHPLQFQFITVFFFRRAIYACSFVLLTFMPEIQISFIVTAIVGMMLYLIMIRPYKSLLSTILALINEILLLSMAIT